MLLSQIDSFKTDLLSYQNEMAYIKGILSHCIDSLNSSVVGVRREKILTHEYL